MGLAAGLLLVMIVLCGLAYAVTQPGVAFVTGPAWTPPVRPPAAGTAAPLPQADSAGTGTGLQVGGRATISSDVNRVNLRRSPGYLNKPGDDVLGTVPSGAVLDVMGGPQDADNLRWWQVKYQDQLGWMAETRAGGAALLEPAP